MPRGGKQPGAGRPKGSPNKITADVKAAILQAFELEGGVEYLRQVARDDQKTFCALLGRVLPLQLTGDSAAPIQVQIVRYSAPE